jgi:hypothetical protein
MAEQYAVNRNTTSVGQSIFIIINFKMLMCLNLFILSIKIFVERKTRYCRLEIFYVILLKMSLGRGYPVGRLPGIGGQCVAASSALSVRILSEASQRPNGSQFVS